MPEEPEQKQESVEEVLAAMRRYADIVECGPPPLGKAISELLREYADRFGRAAKQDYEEAKAYFEKLHDGPSMICTAKNCALRNAAEDIVEQVKAEASFGHFAPVVLEEHAVGNAAALREALNQLRDWALLDINENAIRSDEYNYKKLVDGIVEITNAALAAPARNADRFATLDEAREAFQEMRGHRISADVELWDSMDEAGAFVRWLFDEPNDEQHGGAPAPDGAERGANGDTK